MERTSEIYFYALEKVFFKKTFVYKNGFFIYREAGEHLLTALNQQAAGRNLLGEKAPPKAMSDTIWSTLRLVVSLMHKFHLNEAIENR